MKKKTSLKAITVKVRGYLRRTLKKQDDAANRKIFAEVSHELWPNKSSPGTTTLGPGVHTWDFSLLLPTSFSSDKGTLHTLPPSFSHPKFRDHVVYEMSLLLEKGGLFSFNEG